MFTLYGYHGALLILILCFQRQIMEDIYCIGYLLWLSMDCLGILIFFTILATVFNKVPSGLSLGQSWISFVGGSLWTYQWLLLLRSLWSMYPLHAGIQENWTKSSKLSVNCITFPSDFSNAQCKRSLHDWHYCRHHFCSLLLHFLRTHHTLDRLQIPKTLWSKS